MTYSYTSGTHTPLYSLTSPAMLRTRIIVIIMRDMNNTIMHISMDTHIGLLVTDFLSLL